MTPTIKVMACVRRITRKSLFERHGSVMDCGSSMGMPKVASLRGPTVVGTRPGPGSAVGPNGSSPSSVYMTGWQVGELDDSLSLLKDFAPYHKARLGDEALLAGCLLAIGERGLQK